jgi:hypothetical protein
MTCLVEVNRTGAPLDPPASVENHAGTGPMVAVRAKRRADGVASGCGTGGRNRDRSEVLDRYWGQLVAYYGPVCAFV